MNSETSLIRSVSPFEWAVFFTLVIIVALVFFRFEANDIHNTFSNITATWNQS